MAERIVVTIAEEKIDVTISDAAVDVTINEPVEVLVVDMNRGYSGYSGKSGYSGFSAASPGASGYSGYSGYSGFSGRSGFSGANPGASGYSGFSGRSGYSGFSGKSGYSGYSGIGTSGFSGFSGANPGASGYSGFSGKSGYSGYSGVVPIIASVSLTGQVADIVDTTLTSTAGLYRVAYYILDTVADLTAGAVTLNIKYTDDAGARTLSTSPVILTAITGFAQGEVIARLASGNLTYGVTHSGSFGTAQYALYLTAERLI